jgi:hypothetical protein
MFNMAVTSCSRAAKKIGLAHGSDCGLMETEFIETQERIIWRLSRTFKRSPGA